MPAFPRNKWRVYFIGHGDLKLYFKNVQHISIIVWDYVSV